MRQANGICGVCASEQSMRYLLILSILCAFPFVSWARNVVVPPMPTSPYADTEVSTNIVFNNRRSDVKTFDFNFVFEGVSSNSIEVAFGYDKNSDRELSPFEIGAVYGWNNGKYFAEDYKLGIRYQEKIPEVGRSKYSVTMKMASDYTANEFNAAVGSALIFTNLTEAVPCWLYRPEWNIMRITRRGTSLPSEWFTCDIKYAYFYMIVR